MSPDDRRRYAIPQPPNPEPPEGARPRAGGGGTAPGRVTPAWVVLDATGAILRVSDAWRAFLRARGVDAAQAGVGQDYAAVLQGAVPGVPATLAAGVRRVLAGAAPIHEQEIAWTDAGGTHGMRIVVTPSVGGRGEGAVVTHLDETAEAGERRDARRARVASLERVERIARVGSWEIVLPERRWSGSAEAHRILGVEPGGLDGRHDGFLEMVHPEDRERVRAAHERALAGEADLDVEHRIIRTDGEVRHVRERAVRPDPARLLGTLQDVTDHHRVERQLLRAERLEAIATLANGVGHDLNNVLSPILLSLELLRTGGLGTAAAAETLAVIEASAHRGAEVVRQLLSFAPGADGSQVELQLRHLLRDVEKVVRSTFPKPIAVQVQVPARLWPVTGEPAQIRQVVLSLCLNARDAMPAGGTLTIAAENLVLDEHYRASVGEGLPGPYVCVRVEDTGHGVPAGMLERIFDPFFTTRGRGGTGLGLSTALAVVRRHGGFIRVQSDPGAGAVFRVYLPAAPGPGPLPAHGEPALPRGRGECVLVVDDEAAVREVTRRTLERHGYRPILAADGAEALVLFTERRQEIAVVLTDMMMPLVDGRALMAALRRADPRVRIVAMSGAAHGPLPAGGTEAGAEQFLGKPFTSAALLTALRAALDAGAQEA